MDIHACTFRLLLIFDQIHRGKKRYRDLCQTVWRKELFWRNLAGLQSLLWVLIRKKQCYLHYDRLVISLRGQMSVRSLFVSWNFRTTISGQHLVVLKWTFLNEVLVTSPFPRLVCKFSQRNRMFRLFTLLERLNETLICFLPSNFGGFVWSQVVRCGSWKIVKRKKKPKSRVINL